MLCFHSGFICIFCFTYHLGFIFRFFYLFFSFLGFHCSGVTFFIFTFCLITGRIFLCRGIHVFRFFHSFLRGYFGSLFCTFFCFFRCVFFAFFSF